eukprot:gene14135-15612_t
MENDETSSLLVTILDVNSAWWRQHDAKSKPEESFFHCLESVIVFINSHLLLKHTNKLGFIICHNKKSTFVYPNEDNSNTNSSIVRDGKYEEFIRLDESVINEIKRIHENSTDAALKINSRILVIKGTSDVAAQYMPVMSCIFAAQKNFWVEEKEKECLRYARDIVIDGCVLGEDSGYLQQAADITGGNYLKAMSVSGLLQYLLWVFLPDPVTRKSLVLPASSQIDYRGACFCHRVLLDVGFVCSVCLSSKLSTI